MSFSAAGSPAIHSARPSFVGSSRGGLAEVQQPEFAGGQVSAGLRRELLDRVLILGEGHLRSAVAEYGPPAPGLRPEPGLGGIQGYYDTRPPTKAERVTLVQRATLGHLRTALGVDDGAWPAAREAVAVTSDKLGRIDSK